MRELQSPTTETAVVSTGGRCGTASDRWAGLDNEPWTPDLGDGAFRDLPAAALAGSAAP